MDFAAQQASSGNPSIHHGVIIGSDVASESTARAAAGTASAKNSVESRWERFALKFGREALAALQRCTDSESESATGTVANDSGSDSDLRVRANLPVVTPSQTPSRTGSLHTPLLREDKWCRKHLPLSASRGLYYAQLTQVYSVFNQVSLPLAVETNLDVLVSIHGPRQLELVVKLPL
jgi:hypothetical protein